MARRIIPFQYHPKTTKKAQSSPLKLWGIDSFQDTLDPFRHFRGKDQQVFTSGSISGLTQELTGQKEQFAGMDTSNLYAGVENQYANIENVYEDVTIPQAAYQLKRRQREQGLATGLQAMKESGLGAGSAQLIANAATRGAAEDTAQISQDIYKNELLKAGEASKLEVLERRGESEAQQMRIQGAVDARNLGFQKQQALMSLTAGELASIREADAYKTANSGKIICTELYEQGYLDEDIWKADEQWGEVIREKDPKLLFGYHVWAIYVVKFMQKYPQYTKYVYMLTKPWTEYMANKMGVIKKNTMIGKISNWVGTQFSYYVANRVIRKNKGLNLVKK